MSNKFIDCIRNNRLFILISIIVVIGSAIDLVTKFLSGSTIILSFLKSALTESLYFYGQKIAILRILILIPWVIVILLFIILVKKYFLSKKSYKDIRIYFIGQKLIVRFLDKHSSKEYADGRIICGNCRIPLEEAPNRMEICPRCGLGYNQGQTKLIIAVARSKWITGKEQKGYIKTGKTNTQQ